MRRRTGRVGRAARLAGGALVASGALVLAFVAFQVWGTSFQESRAQDRLRRELAPSLVSSPVADDSPVVAVPAAPTTTTTAAPAVAPPALGDPVAVLRIPKLGLDKVVVEGTGGDELAQGPGHYPTTPLPGRAGNVAIAGHRTTYGAPFYAIDELVPGDEILVTTIEGDARYVVTGATVVAPSDVSVLAPTGGNVLTLTTCEPRYSARSRLIVSATLDGEPLDAPAGVAVQAGS